MTPTFNMGMLVQRLENILIAWVFSSIILVAFCSSNALASPPPIGATIPQSSTIRPWGAKPFLEWFGEQFSPYENETWEQRLHRIMFTNLTNLGGSTVALKDRQVQCLAKNIYYESRGESLAGQVAVAKVTLTRVSEGYAKTVCGVVNQSSPNGCQFSWVCNRNNPKPVGELWQQAVSISALLIHAPQGVVNDPTNGATHFHATYSVRPNWAVKKNSPQRIGNHIFYTISIRENK